MELKNVFEEFKRVKDKVVAVKAWVPTEYQEGLPGIVCLKHGIYQAEDFDHVAWIIPKFCTFDNESAIIRYAIALIDEGVAKLEKEIMANV